MLILATFFWAGNFAIGKFAFLEDIPPYSLTFFRWLTVWLILFPFTYKGKMYTNCTLDGDSSGGSWCSTLVDESGNHVGGQHWGTCGTNCLISHKKIDKEISKCKTIDGPDVKKQCVFPFKFKGMTYNTCTWEGDSTGGAWCSTVLGDSGQRVDGVNWGNCGRDCSIPSQPKGKNNKCIL